MSGLNFIWNDLPGAIIRGGFKISSDETRFSSLLNMSSGVSGYKGGMNAQLVSDGQLYGMTSYGGMNGQGDYIRLSQMAVYLQNCFIQEQTMEVIRWVPC